VVGGVTHLVDLGEGVEDRGAHPLTQGDLGHAAALAAAAHVNECNSLGDIEQIDVPAMGRDGRVDLVIEQALHSLGDGIEPQWVGILHAHRAHRKVGVESDAVEVRCGRERYVNGETGGGLDDHVPLPLLAGCDQLHVVDECAVLATGDGNPQAGLWLFAIHAHLLDARQRGVGGADPGFLHDPLQQPERDRVVRC